MPTSYTPNLRLSLQGDGDNPNTWGDITNTQVIDLIEAAITGVVQVPCTGSSDVNIATSTENGAPDTARNAVLQLVGTLGANIQLIVPSVQKIYIVDCLWSGPYTITIIPTGGSSGIEMSSGTKYIVYSSGTTIGLVAESTSVGVLLAANNLSDLTNITTARTNLGLGAMALQDSASVNITGGTISGVTGLSAVTSVAGRTGAVVLANTDISGLGTGSTLNAGTSANNLVQLDGSGHIPSSVLASTIRAWVTFDGTTSPATIKASSNVSSVINSGSGRYIVNFTTPMTDVNYALSGSGCNTGSNYIGLLSENPLYARTTSSVGIVFYNGASGATMSFGSVIVVGN